jgi:hypothetical protein
MSALRERNTTAIVVRVPKSLNARLEEAAKRDRKSKSAFIRKVLESHVGGPKSKRRPTLMDLAGDLIGAFSGGPTDLASNPKHMEDYGKGMCINKRFSFGVVLWCNSSHRGMCGG